MKKIKCNIKRVGGILCLIYIFLFFEVVSSESKKIIDFVDIMFENEIKKELNTLKSEFLNGVSAYESKEDKIISEDATINKSRENLKINNQLNDEIKENNKNELGTKSEGNFSFEFKEINSNSSENKTKKMKGNKTADKVEFDTGNTKNISDDKSKNNLIENWLKISSPEFFKPFSIQNITSKTKNLRIKLNSEDFRINEAFEQTKSNEDNLPKNPEYFWFRLVKKDLFYTKTKTDFNVIGSMQYINVSKYNPLCMSVKDKCIQWSVCANSKQIINEFYCAMKKYLNEKSFECQDDDNINKNIPKKFFQPIIIVPIPSRNCNQNWNYFKGGRDWECNCSDGKLQSPIDLPDKSEAIDSAIRPSFNYHRIEQKLSYSTVDNLLSAGDNIKIRFLENAIRILHNNLGSITTLDGAVYVAEEIVFHVPSEHTISGKRFDMEMQVIHFGRSKGDISKQVVLSFLFQKTPGVYNRFIDDIDFYSLPNIFNKEKDILNDLYIPKVQYRSDDRSYEPVLKPFSFYTYQGSLTFPPCTERTIYYVAADPIPLGSIFIQLMEEAIKDKSSYRSNLIGESLFIKEESNLKNIRETQPLNGRLVFYFDHVKYCFPYKRVPCNPTKTSEDTTEERYESSKIEHVKYFSSVYQTITFPWKTNEKIIESNESNIK